MRKKIQKREKKFHPLFRKQSSILDIHYFIQKVNNKQKKKTKLYKRKINSYKYKLLLCMHTEVKSFKQK